MHAIICKLLLTQTPGAESFINPRCNLLDLWETAAGCNGYTAGFLLMMFYKWDLLKRTYRPSAASVCLIRSCYYMFFRSHGRMVVDYEMSAQALLKFQYLCLFHQISILALVVCISSSSGFQHLFNLCWYSGLQKFKLVFCICFYLNLYAVF